MLLVGGSSKSPRVGTRLLARFGEEEHFVRSDCIRDEVVARGAAFLAQRFQGSQPPFDLSRKSIGGLNLDVDLGVKSSLITEHSLGLGVQENRFHRIIKKGQEIPISITEKNFTN